MKNKILSAYPQSSFQSSISQVIYVADFSERSRQKRGVEIHEQQPCSPNSSEYMDCLKLNNPQCLSIDFNIFDDNQFKDNERKDCEHCECCLFPTENETDNWVAFIEIKDCKAKNISEFKDKAKSQIISTVKRFKEFDIIDKQRIYGIISFPRKEHLSANQTRLIDRYEYRELHKTEKIHLLISNELDIKDKQYISESRTQYL